MLVLLLLAGCASPPSSDGSWELVSATDAAGSFDLPPITLTVDGESFTGGAPCNSYSGTFFSGFTTTERGCADLALEQRYYAALGLVDDASVVEGMLALTRGDSAWLEFMLTRWGPVNSASVDAGEAPRDGRP